jgi:hypothetical protein
LYAAPAPALTPQGQTPAVVDAELLQRDPEVCVAVHLIAMCCRLATLY